MLLNSIGQRKYMYRKPTKEAQDLKIALEKLGLRVLVEVNDGHKHIDLTLPDARINIEVDGSQHLTDPYQILSDLKREHYSDDLGYDTVHIPNQAIHTNLGGIASALAEAGALRIEGFKKREKNQNENAKN
jgi:very-short-patch-repair endonuclease